MEFPLSGLVAMNSSEAVGGQSGSLYSRKPVVASFYAGVLGVAAVVGTLGNLVVIVTVIVKQIRRRRTTGNGVGRAFIANLALSDLIVTAVINPLAIAGTVMGQEQLLGGRPWLCSSAASLCIVSCVNSLLTIAVIAVNRYLYVCWNSAYDIVFTRRRTIVIVVSTWVVGVVIDSPNHLGWSSHHFDNKTQKCLWNRTDAYHYTLFFVVVGMLLPFIITSVCYWRIFVHIRLAKQRILTQIQDATEVNYVATMKTIRQVKTVFIIFIAFVLCWSPYVFVLLYDRSDSLPLYVHLYTSMLAHLHASLNFAIYSLNNHNLWESCRRSADRVVNFCRRRFRPNNIVYNVHYTRTNGDRTRIVSGVDINRTFVTVECNQMQNDEE